MPIFRTEPFFLAKLRSHFRADPNYLPIVTEFFERHEHPDVQLSLQTYCSQEGRKSELLGVLEEDFLSRGISLPHLLRPADHPQWGRSAPKEGPVLYINVPLEKDRVLTCVQRGLYLVAGQKERLAILVEVNRDMSLEAGKIKMEVMASDQSQAESFLRTFRAALRQGSVFRGRVLVLTEEEWPRVLKINFHALPPVAREAIIFPQGLLERIERQALGFGQHREALRALGRHLKRGLLLHGPPGTGKTLTAMYLVGKSSDRTVILLTGPGLSLIAKTCDLARALQPSMVILEDVDLVAEERTRPGSVCTNALLFELLNQMDGLEEDADILFLLTTNRPDILEPALASRPGRIDQAYEIPLPDAHCRRCLFQLYSQGLNLRLDSFDPFIKRTKGASGAFIREMMRKAALFAVEEEGDPVIEERHLEEALEELVVQGKELTKSLLGFRSGPGPMD